MEEQQPTPLDIAKDQFKKARKKTVSVVEEAPVLATLDDKAPEAPKPKRAPGRPRKYPLPVESVQPVQAVQAVQAVQEAPKEPPAEPEPVVDAPAPAPAPVIAAPKPKGWDESSMKLYIKHRISKELLRAQQAPVAAAVPPPPPSALTQALRGALGHELHSAVRGVPYRHYTE